MAAVKRYLWILALLVACGGAHMQTVQLLNKTDRQINELYVYPAGSTNHGSSRGQLAPNGSTQVSVKQGNIEVLAVSAKLQVDEHTRDQPTASGSLELTGPAQVVFYDADSQPPGLDRPGVFGIAFIIPASKKPAGDPSEAAPAPSPSP